MLYIAARCAFVMSSAIPLTFVPFQILFAITDDDLVKL